MHVELRAVREELGGGLAEARAAAEVQAPQGPAGGQALRSGVRQAPAAREVLRSEMDDFEK